MLLRMKLLIPKLQKNSIKIELTLLFLLWSMISILNLKQSRIYSKLLQYGLST
ncbi:hypothetical protein MJO28_011683 [Puccinia striiformis f. sp. tritici]|uniref:Uncharacterized protein n=1 Tax=Puccinia striiformis f. sp. tritici TaxID=168172 RepID=A0ACC0E509_9BASI|nr:hypothetical protein MJO28_011683 [Puccinia striiformis f. sp. tritici]